MNKNLMCVFLIGILFSVTLLSGCDQIIPENPTTYVMHPTNVRYTLTYGYEMNCTGSGKYEITYLCDFPEVLHGSTTAQLLYPVGYQNVSLVNNTLVRWNLSGNDVRTYELGITSQVIVESFLVNDLNGRNALTVQEIRTTYPSLVQNYTHVQSNMTSRFIDPQNPDVLEIVEDVHTKSKTNNSFLLAKSLFVWLKEQTQYKVHPNEPGVQPVAMTLQKKTGDCDDLSFLYISLCRAAGIPARFIRGYLITKDTNDTVTAIAHAWSEVFVGGSLGNNGWVPVECACCTTSIETDINQNFGVENAFHVRLFVDDGSNLSLSTSLSGIAYVTYGTNRQVAAVPFVTITNYQELNSQKLIVTDDNLRYYE